MRSIETEGDGAACAARDWFSRIRSQQDRHRLANPTRPLPPSLRYGAPSRIGAARRPTSSAARGQRVAVPVLRRRYQRLYLMKGVALATWS